MSRLYSLEGIPPSVNSAYVSITKRVGKKTVVLRCLSEAGKAYHRSVVSHIARQVPTGEHGITPNTPYGLAILVTSPTVLNSTWPNAASTRYKKMDVSNRIKLLEDALADALGVDDSNFIVVIGAKEPGVQDKTTIVFWNLLNEGCMPDAVREILDRVVPRM